MSDFIDNTQVVLAACDQAYHCEILTEKEYKIALEALNEVIQSARVEGKGNRQATACLADFAKTIAKSCEEKEQWTGIPGWSLVRRELLRLDLLPNVFTDIIAGYLEDEYYYEAILARLLQGVVEYRGVLHIAVDAEADNVVIAQKSTVEDPFHPANFVWKPRDDTTLKAAVVSIEVKEEGPGHDDRFYYLELVADYREKTLTLLDPTTASPPEWRDHVQTAAVQFVRGLVAAAAAAPPGRVPDVFTVNSVENVGNSKLENEFKEFSRRTSRIWSWLLIYIHYFHCNDLGFAALAREIEESHSVYRLTALSVRRLASNFQVFANDLERLQTNIVDRPRKGDLFQQWLCWLSAYAERKSRVAEVFRKLADTHRSVDLSNRVWRSLLVDIDSDKALRQIENAEWRTIQATHGGTEEECFDAILQGWTLKPGQQTQQDNAAHVYALCSPDGKDCESRVLKSKDVLVSRIGPDSLTAGEIAAIASENGVGPHVYSHGICGSGVNLQEHIMMDRVQAAVDVEAYTQAIDLYFNFLMDHGIAQNGLTPANVGRDKKGRLVFRDFGKAQRVPIGTWSVDTVMKHMRSAAETLTLDTQWRMLDGTDSKRIREAVEQRLGEIRTKVVEAKLTPTPCELRLMNGWKPRRLLGFGAMGSVYTLCNPRNNDCSRILKKAIFSEKKGADEGRIATIAAEFGVAPTVFRHGVCKSEDGRDWEIIVAQRIDGPRLDETAYPTDSGLVGKALDIYYSLYLNRHIAQMDLKPTNAMLDSKTGRLYLIDYGVAKEFTQQEWDERTARQHANHMLTMARLLIRTWTDEPQSDAAWRWSRDQDVDQRTRVWVRMATAAVTWVVDTFGPQFDLGMYFHQRLNTQLKEFVTYNTLVNEWESSARRA